MGIQMMRCNRLMTAFTIAGLSIVVVATTACGERDRLLAVTAAEESAVQQLRAGTHEVVAKSDLDQLRQQAQLGKSVGRYSQYVSGFRTWRLDSATGDTCLLLTTDEDWKKPDVSVQGCGFRSK
jgi:hypothetical protein